MTDMRPETDDPAGGQHALVTLHALTRPDDRPPGEKLGVRPTSAATALAALAAAPEDEVPIAARLHVLHRLAQADFPEYSAAKDQYRAVAASVAQRRPGISADALLDDLKESARAGIPFARTPSGTALAHRDTAFIDDDVCQIRAVEVDGLPAVWIFSEFETDASFESVAEWVDPNNWPKRGSLLFKSMAPAPGTQIAELGPPGDDHWHGVFREVVQLVQQLTTDLHCDYWLDRGAGSAGMTYQLDKSMGDQITVDRGFLLVNDTGSIRRVKALKIVGFTTGIWDDVATLVCPFWTDWVRGAVEGGSSSTPVPGSPPAGGAPGPNPFADNLEAWLQFAGESTRSYLDIVTDATGRLAKGTYGSADWVGDGLRTWSQLAKDWARAWNYGRAALDEVAEHGLDAGLTPPGTPREQARGAFSTLTAAAAAAAAAAASPAGPAASAAAAQAPAAAASGRKAAAEPAGESTTIPWPGLTGAHRLVCSDLQSIEDPSTIIPAAELAIDVVQLAGGVPGARVRAVTTQAPAGLYVGHVLAESGKRLQPVQLYVSGASEAAGP